MRIVMKFVQTNVDKNDWSSINDFILIKSVQMLYIWSTPLMVLLTHLFFFCYTVDEKFIRTYINFFFFPIFFYIRKVEFKF